MISKLKKIKRLALKSLQGFTLVETLIAVFVLMMAIAGPLTIAAKGLQLALVAKDQVTAFYLAQDATEYIRFARDTNRLGGSSGTWLTGSQSLANCVSSNGSVTCYMDTLGNNPSAPTACTGTCPVMDYDSSSNLFTYAAVGGTVSATIFTRTTQIITPVGTNAGEAISSTTVSWSDQGGITRRVQVREDIFNWQ